MNHMLINVPICAGGTIAVGTTNVFALKAPSAEHGGGLTIDEVNYYSRDAIAAGSAPSFELVTLGTDDAINGTLSAATGSSAFTAGTAKAGTVSSGWVDADYRVAVKWIQTAANGAELFLNAGIHCTMGK